MIGSHERFAGFASPGPQYPVFSAQHHVRRECSELGRWPSRWRACVPSRNLGPYGQRRDHRPETRL